MLWLKRNGKIRGDEKCKVILPERDAKERIRNVAKRKRIVIVTDDFGYSQFHARREAWMGALDKNPTLFLEALDAAMSGFDIIGWKENKEKAGA